MEGVKERGVRFIKVLVSLGYWVLFMETRFSMGGVCFFRN